MNLRKMSEQEYLFAEKIYSPDPLSDPRPLPFDEEKAKRDYQNLRNTFGVFDGEKVVGYLYFKTSGEIGVLILNNNLRGRGYGTKAVSEALVLAKQNDISKVFAETDEKNIPMRKILENLGFIPTKAFVKTIPPDINPKNFIRYERTV